ncbi:MULTISPECIES: hypothetical protein [Streptomyces]|uniref:hypothetical protein n=2 Tax=[Kitasatospora] papulosa TaxID=1464011 RepID=UPI0036BE611A
MTPALDHTRRLLDTPPTPPIPGQLDLTRSDMATTDCTTWLVTPQTIAAVDDAVDGYGTYAKGYFEFVDGRTTVVGLRVGTGPDRVVARFGDTLVRHHDGRWSVRPATP